jgi:hypothetical protein
VWAGAAAPAAWASAGLKCGTGWAVVVGEVLDMKKTDLRFYVDAFLFISIVGIVLIGFLLGFVLPEGPAASEDSKYFLGLHRHAWGDIHLYLGVAFTVLAALHVILGWSWVKGKARQLFRRGWKAALVSVPVLAFFVLFFFWSLSLSDTDQYADYGRGAATGQAVEEAVADGEVLVTGQVTLADLEESTGIPTGELSESLGLPAEVPSDERLGRLKQKYPFTMDEVRDVVTDHTSSSIKASENHYLEEEPKLTRGRNAEDVSGILITGQVSLRDIERQTGVSARHLAQRLGLPVSTPVDERLGRLRKTYDFSLQDVRDVLSKLMKR